MLPYEKGQKIIKKVEIKMKFGDNLTMTELRNGVKYAFTRHFLTAFHHLYFACSFIFISF